MALKQRGPLLQGEMFQLNAHDHIGLERFANFAAEVAVDLNNLQLRLGNLPFGLRDGCDQLAALAFEARGLPLQRRQFGDGHQMSGPKLARSRELALHQDDLLRLGPLLGHVAANLLVELLYALALDLPENHFDACFAKPHMILRQSRYPVIDGADDTVASLVPHTDSGFMTLLPPNKVQGLSILLPSGQWMDAPNVEDAFVVNGGDILHRWTNERFLSTPHRVRNVSGTVRYAIPFFCDPDHDTVIECLPSCQSVDNPQKYPPIKFGDYALWFAAQRYQHMQNVKAPSADDVAPGARATEAWKS